MNGGVETGNYNVTVNDVALTGFCVDPATSTGSHDYYQMSVTAGGVQYEAAAWVLDQQRANAFSGDSNAAIDAQIAVWKLVMDWGNANLSTGKLTYSGTYASAAQTIINNAIADYSIPADWATNVNQYSLVVSPNMTSFFDVQDQDYLIPGSTSTTVPLPAAVWLLGSGLVGLVGIRRRLRKK